MPWRLNPFTGDLYLDEVGSGGTGGGGSSGVTTYVHTQSSSSATWTINHGLGSIPSTELFNSSNVEIEGTVSHPSVNATEVTFSSPISGFARLIGDEVPPITTPTSYVHTQSSASSVWTINHNLGFIPSTELFSSGSVEIDGDVEHVSVNQTVVTFLTPISGFARLN
jgi:hypothetical protein